MFDNLDLNDIKGRLAEMQNETKEQSFKDDLTSFDFAGRLNELTEILSQLSPLKDLLEGVLTPNEVSELDTALDECHTNLNTMSKEVEKLNKLQGE